MGLLRQAELIDLRVVVLTRCTRLVCLGTVAPTRYARLVGLRVVTFDEVR